MPDRVGWKNPIGDPKSYELANSAKKFEYGTLNFAAIAAFQNSLTYQFDIGIMEIEKRILELVSYLWLELENIGLTLFTPKHTKSPIVSVLVKDAKKIGEILMRDRIKITARNNRKGHLRVSPHFYNTKNDINHLLRV